MQQLCSKGSGAQGCVGHRSVPRSSWFKELDGESACKVHNHPLNCFTSQCRRKSSELLEN